MSVLLNFLLFVLPFVFIPINGFQFEIPKVILSEITVAAILIIIFLKNEEKTIKIDKRLISIVCGIAILTIIDLIFFRTVTSFFGNAFRLQGIFLLWLLLLLSIASSIIKVKEFKINWLIFALIGELLLSFIIGFTQDGRIVGTLGEPNMLASFVIFLLPLILFNTKAGNKIKLASVAIALLLLFFTGSRSGAIAFILEILTLLLFKVKKLPLNKTVFIIIFLTVISLGLPLLDKTTSFLENRKEIWKISLTAGFKNPLFGNGFGNIEETIKNEAVKERSPIQYAYIDSSHNLILDWWVEGGLVGVIIILSTISFTIYNLTKKQQTMYLFAFMGILVTMLFNPSSVIGFTEFFFLAGLSFQNQL